MNTRIGKAMAAAACACLATETFCDFTLMIIPDTQYMMLENSYQGSNYAQYTTQIKWVVARKDSLNIRFIAHLGDVVDHVDNAGEWSRFKKGWVEIEGTGVPWAIPPGNHDTDLPMGADSWNRYNREYSASDFMSWPWAVETYPSGRNQNNLSFSTGDSIEFMVVSIGYQDEYNWADRAQKKYGHKRAIINTHDVQEGAYVDLAKRNPNVFLIVSGHPCGPEWTNVHRNETGGTFHEIMSDYQCGLNGFLRYYVFRTAQNKVEAYTYRPWNNGWRRSPTSQFSFAYKMANPNPPVAIGMPGDGLRAGAGHAKAPARERFSVFSARGEVVLSDRNLGAQGVLLERLPRGLYSVVTTDGDGLRKSRRFLRI